MNEELSIDDPTQLLQAASEFAHYPGVLNDVSAKDLLNRFPLPIIINALQTRHDVPGLENTLVACLERLFKTKFGASLIPHYMPFVEVGLQADSQVVRSLACKTVTSLLENLGNETDVLPSLITDFNIYPLLLDCLINGNEQVAAEATDAIRMLAGSPEGLEIIFPLAKGAKDLEILTSRCSSLGRVRVMALVVKLFSVSRSAASIVYRLNLLNWLEAEIRNADDTLVTLSVLELLYELAEVDHGAEFLSKTSLLQLLSSIISNDTKESILRSRAMLISGRLLSKEMIYSFVDELCVKTIISAIDGRLKSGTLERDEFETALETLGHIGTSTQGATLLLSGSPPAARHVIGAAFDRQGPQGHGRQLAALHALGNISGESRSENNIILINADAEESLRRLIFEVACSSSKLTPSGLFLSVLQQDSEIRLAGYRVICGLVARPWCLVEICSKPEVINIVTDPSTETTKIAMEARYNCCKAIHKSLMLSTNLSTDPALAGTVAKLQEAVARGPYLVRKHVEAQPVVMTAERF